MDVSMNKEIIPSLILLFYSLCFSCRYYFHYIRLVLCDTDYYSRILFLVPEFVISLISGLLNPSPMRILISGKDLYFMFTKTKPDPVFVLPMLFLSILLSL